MKRSTRCVLPETTSTAYSPEVKPFRSITAPVDVSRAELLTSLPVASLIRNSRAHKPSGMMISSEPLEIRVRMRWLA